MNGKTPMEGIKVVGKNKLIMNWETVRKAMQYYLNYKWARYKSDEAIRVQSAKANKARTQMTIEFESVKESK